LHFPFKPLSSTPEPLTVDESGRELPLTLAEGWAAVWEYPHSRRVLEGKRTSDGLILEA
jgi:hypothetical protein